MNQKAISQQQVQDDAIRAAVMNGGGEKIRALILNNSQIYVVNLVNSEKEMTASTLSVALGISIQNASQKLKTLWRRGYIDCYARSAETGGTEYVYQPLSEVSNG